MLSTACFVVSQNRNEYMKSDKFQSAITISKTPILCYSVSLGNLKGYTVHKTYSLHKNLIIVFSIFLSQRIFGLLFDCTGKNVSNHNYHHFPLLPGQSKKNI